MNNNNAPLASLLVIFYNQENFVADTVKGALSQTYSNLEIIFSDDCSTDGTFQAIKEAVKDYNGPHKIIINRNEPNMGLVPHVNKELFKLSHGEFLFLNGGDDISLPMRVEQGVKYFLQHEEVSAVTFSRITIDKYGNEIGRENMDGDIIQSINDIDYILASGFMTKGVGLSIRRRLLDIFGPLSDDCQTEDSTLRFRAMLVGKTLKSSEYGLKYRVHDTNISNNIFKLKTDPISRQYIDDLEKVKNTLDAKLHRVLLKKVDCYVGIRNLDEKISKSNILMKIVYKIVQKVKLKNYQAAIRRIIG